MKDSLSACREENAGRADGEAGERLPSGTAAARPRSGSSPSRVKVRMSFTYAAEAPMLLKR